MIVNPQGTALEAALSELVPRTHLCLIYRSEGEQLAVAALFVRLGLQLGERCVYLCDEGREERVRRALSDAGVDVDLVMATGALLLLTRAQASLKGNEFDAYRLFLFWKNQAELARLEGFEGLRGTLSCQWVVKGAVPLDQWLECEGQLTRIAAECGCTLLCQFGRDMHPDALIVNAIRVHPGVIYGESLSTNTHHMQEMRSGSAQSAEPEQLLWAIRERAQAELALRRERDELLRSEKRLRDALRSTQAELARVSRVLALGDLTASIAHEVMQPLASLIANGGATLRWLAAEVPNLEEGRQGVLRMIEDGRRANAVIGRIRALARKADRREEPVDVTEAINEVLALMTGELAQNEVTVDTRLEQDLPAVMGDRVQLQQVVLNLVINAVDAVGARPGGARDILIAAWFEETARQVHISVRDSGVGLPAEQAEMIFSSFYTTKPHGMGIGLSITRSIVEAHAGQVWAEQNQNGPGTTFHVTLPAGGAAEPNTDV